MDYSLLKTLRREKKIKLYELAKKVGISTAYLSLIERNKRQPKVETIEDICKLLDCELRIIAKA